VALVPLTIPPGYAGDNTEYQGKGRVTAGNLVRWYGVQLGPVPGSRVRASSAVTGKCRRILPWRDDNGGRLISLATEQQLAIQNSAGDLFDITPAGLTAGEADAIAAIGYGAGPYGSYAYGIPRPDTGDLTPATVCDLDTWGQYLLFVSPADGRLFLWQLDTAVDAAVVAAAPTNLTGALVTEQDFVFAFAGRTVAWCDQRDITTWTPSATNQAGDQDLQTQGQIIGGIRLGPQALILTDVDAHAANYLGPPFIYGFNRVGHGCGAISKGCAVSSGQRAAWWGKSQFWAYDGAVQPLPCAVWDTLQADLNSAQKSKITGYHNVQNGEFWWHYPSTQSTECDSYVFWNYRANYWAMGRLARTAASEAAVFNYPLAVGTDGKVYEHEVPGVEWDSSPYADVIVELGSGDRVMKCTGIVGDEKTVGDCEVSGATRAYPNSPEVAFTSAILAAGATDIRFSGRQARLRFSFSDAEARLGTVRLDLMPGGRR
jgi:hypothetical protein